MPTDKWKRDAFEIVRKIASEKEEFTPDDIWEAGLEKPAEARVLGSVMLRAKNQGLIEKTGRVQRTTQQESHGTDVTVWRSLIFKP